MTKDHDPTWIGFYGCNGELIRVQWIGSVAWRRQNLGAVSAHRQAHTPSTRRPKTSWRVHCPGCDQTHQVNVTWRELGRRESDAEFEPDVHLPKGAT